MKQQLITAIIGPPCSGKTTLAKALSTCLGVKHISVGDLIRTAVEDDKRAELQSAYRGYTLFPVDWLAQHLQAGLDQIRAPHVVIDGGLSLPAALSSLDHTVRTIFVNAEQEIMDARFHKRASAKTRDDDVLHIFQRRCVLFRSEQKRLAQQAQAIGPFVVLSADTTQENLLRQALAASSFWNSMTGAHDRANTTTGITDAAEVLCDLSEARVDDATRLVFIRRDGSTDSAPDNEMVVLVKPGFTPSPAVVTQVLNLLAANGYAVAAVSKTSGALARRCFEAHFDLQHAAARHGSKLLNSADHEHLQKLWPGDKLDLQAACEMAEADGLSHLDHLWRDDTPGGVLAINPGLWARRIPGTDTVIINGHIPLILDQYQRANLVTLALHIVGSDCSSFSYMRKSVLGPTDPTQAPPGSLRYIALVQGRAAGMAIDRRNNGFHMSSSLPETWRELGIWFGPEYLSSALARSSWAIDPAVAAATATRNSPLCRFPKGEDWLWQLTTNLDGRAAMAMIDASHISAEPGEFLKAQTDLR